MAGGQITAGILNAIGGLFQQYGDQSTKPGFKKSEFWLSALGTVLSFIPSIGGPYGPVIGGLLALGYAALRTFVTVRASTTTGVLATAVSNGSAAIVAPSAAPASIASAGGGLMTAAALGGTAITTDTKPGRM